MGNELVIDGMRAPVMEDLPERTPDAGGPGVIYLNCPRCGLSVRSKANWLAVEHCPRCIARRGALVRLFASTLPADVLYAEDTRPDPDGLEPGVSSEPGEDSATVGP